MKRENVSSSLKKTGALLASAAMLGTTAVPASFAFAEGNDGANPTPSDSEQSPDAPVSYPEHAQIVQTTDMEQASNQLKRAKAERDAVEELYQEEKLAYESAKSVLDESKQASDQADIAAIQAELDAQKAIVDELEAKAAEVESAAKELEDAQGELDRLRGEEADAKKEADAAGEALLKAKESYDAVLAETGGDIDERLAAAKSELDAAQQAYDEAEQASSEAQAALESCEEKLAAATEAKSSAKSSLDEAEEKLSGAESRYADALAEYEQAQAEYSRMEDIVDSPEYALAEANVEKAQRDVATAESDIAAAKAEIDKQQGIIDAAVAEKAELEETVASLEGQQATKDAELSEAKNVLDSAQCQLDELTAAAGKSAEAVEKAAAERAEAKSAYEKAEADKAEADRKLSEAKTARESAEAKVKELETAAASKTYDAWDFFGSIEGGLGADAVKVLDLAPKRDHMSKGDPNDATSLANMKESIQWLKRCNEIRASIGLSALQVNYTLMACAQVNANYSASYTHSHSQQFNIGENLAWSSYDNGWDPFDGWYYREKAIYDKAVETGTYDGVELPAGWQNMSGYQLYQVAPGLYQSTGHYLNIIDSSYVYTGYAASHHIPEEATHSYKNTHSQTFSAQPWYAGYNKNLPSGLTFGDATKNGNVSVEQYEEMLDAYIAKVSKEDPALTQAKAELEAAQAAYEQAVKNASDKAVMAEQAKSEYDAADEKHSNAVTEKDAADGKAETARAELERAAADYQSKIEAKASIDAVLEEAQSNVSELASDMETASSLKSQAQERLDNASDAKVDAEADLEAAVSERERLLAGVEAAQKRYAQAAEALAKETEAKGSTESARNEAQQHYGEAATKLETAATEHERAAADARGKAGELEAARGEKTGKQSAYDELVSKKSNLDEAAGKLEEADLNAQAATRVLSNIATAAEQSRFNVTLKEIAATDANTRHEQAKNDLDWETVKAAGGTGGAYASVDAKISAMLEAASVAERMRENLEGAQAVFAPIAASFAVAQVHMDAANDNLKTAQRIYDDAVEWNTDYVVIDGDGATYTEKCGKGLGFRFSGPVDRFVRLLVDGVVVDSANYTVKSGSTIVTLSPEYMGSLATGKHTVSAVYANGDTADASFEIVAAPKEDDEPEGDGKGGMGDGNANQTEGGTGRDNEDPDKIDDDKVPATGQVNGNETLTQTGDDAASLFAGAAVLAAVAGTTALASCIGARRRR